jgi:hypothetical protein
MLRLTLKIEESAIVRLSGVHIRARQQGLIQRLGKLTGRIPIRDYTAIPLSKE